MRMSPFWIARPRSLSVWSTAAAGTISQSVRGGLRLVTRSSSEEAATAPVSFAKASRVFAVGVYTTTSCPPRIKRRVMFAPILPRPIIPSCMAVTPSFPSRPPGRLEEVHELLVAPRDLRHGRLPRRLLRPPGHERIPEHRPAHGEADESRDSGGRRQPVAHLLGVLASAQDDAAHRVATTPARGGDDPLTVLVPVKSLDLPDVGLDLRIFKLLDGQDHQPGPEFQVIGLRVSPEPIELALFRGHEQLEHESAATLVAQIPGQPLQAIRLPPVQGGIALRVVAHQHLAEGRADDFDVVGEVFAVLEVELLLPALLGGTRRDIAVRLGIAEDGRPELLVHEDASLVSGHAGRHGGREAIVDHPFGGNAVSPL